MSSNYTKESIAQQLEQAEHPADVSIYVNT